MYLLKQKFICYYLLIAILLGFSACSYSNPQNKFDHWIKQEMKKENISAVSIAVIQNYKIAWARAFGVMNKITKKSVTVNSLFQAGSISKPIAAFAVLRATQLKDISLDKNINDYLTSWKLPETTDTKKHPVTLRSLLNHSAGVNVRGFYGYTRGKKLPTLIEVLNGVPPANNKPIRVTGMPAGVTFKYSGGGYTIIQQALIDIFHQPFPVILDNLVLKPAKMTNSSFQQPLPEQRLSIAVTPYRYNGKPIKRGPHTYITLAAAGLWTTPTDLAKFTILLQKSLAGQSEFISEHLAQLMVTPSVSNNMGLGFEVNIDRYGKAQKKGNYFKHDGENEGYKNVLLASRTGGTGIIIMTNVNSVDPKKDSWDFIYHVIRKISDMQN